jgi:hypothetical protein
MKKNISTNWRHDSPKNPEASFSEKLRALLKIKDKLVKVQADTIHSMSLNNARGQEAYRYVEQLYKHYIIDKLPKTYLCNQH